MDVSPVDVLRSYTLASLQQMARQRGVEFKKKNKEQMVQELTPVVVKRDAIRASLDDLTPTERLALDRIILAGGDMPTELIRQQLERENRIDRGAKSDRYPYS